MLSFKADIRVKWQKEKTSNEEEEQTSRFHQRDRYYTETIKENEERREESIFILGEGNVNTGFLYLYVYLAE